MRIKEILNFKKFAFIVVATLMLCVASGEVGVLRRNVDRVPSMDPIYAESVAANRCVGLVYETLLQYDYKARPYEVVPYICKSMPRVLDDGKTLEFELRDDVYFGPSKYIETEEGLPDGCRRVTSRDFEYSLKRLADAKLSSPGYWTIGGLIEGVDEFHKRSTQDKETDYSLDISGIEVLDEKIFRIHLTRPSTEVYWILAMPYTAVVPVEAVKKLGVSFGDTEVGSGPFVLKNWWRNYKMEFVRREHRCRERDRDSLSLELERDTDEVKSVLYYVMDDATTRWLSFIGGSLDINGEISRDNWDVVIGEDGLLSRELVDDGITLESKDSMSTTYIAFNMSDEVFKDNKFLRQAISCAFNSMAWEKLNKGRVSVANGPIPNMVRWKLKGTNPYGYDLEKAKTLLEKAGYRDGIDSDTGKRLELVLDLGRTDQQTRESAELVSSFLAEIGIVLRLQYNNWPLFLKKISRRESQMFMLSWLADYPDPMNFLQLFYSKNASPGPNRCNYYNEEFDRLYEKARDSSSEKEKQEAVYKMQEIVVEDCPWVCIHHERGNVLYGSHVTNAYSHDFPYGMEKYWRLKRDEHNVSGKK